MGGRHQKSSQVWSQWKQEMEPEIFKIGDPKMDLQMVGWFSLHPHFKTGKNGNYGDLRSFHFAVGDALNTSTLGPTLAALFWKGSVGIRSKGVVFPHRGAVLDDFAGTPNTSKHVKKFDF